MTPTFAQGVFHLFEGGFVGILLSNPFWNPACQCVEIYVLHTDDKYKQNDLSNGSSFIEQLTELDPGKS